jgi:exosome complex component CSL4
MAEKKFVVPGDFIGTEEEYLAGAGTFSEKERLYSTLTGGLEDEQRRLSVRQGRPLRSLEVGAVIFGRVENVVEPIALVSIIGGSGGERFGGTSDYSVLHASMIKRGYVKNVRDEYKIGDIIRAKIAGLQNGEFRLTTDADDLGAVKAFCGKCRHPMRVESGILKCEECGWKDNRKLANDYRKASVD